MKPSERLWRSIEDIYRSILSHPFIVKLSDCSLDMEAFKYYIVQDSIYLNGFARALSILSSRAYSSKWIKMFAEHAYTAIEVEKALHKSFMQEWGVSEDHISLYNASPTNLAYINHLLASVSL
jgi:thiaminase/transcriptional activator TenA